MKKVEIEFENERERNCAIEVLNTLNNNGIVNFEKISKIKENKKEENLKPGDHYFYLNHTGKIGEDVYTDPNNPFDKDRKIFGNLFKTKEEAEFAVERQKVITELRELADDDNEWGPTDECGNISDHYFIYYNSYSKSIKIDFLTRIMYLPMDLYFKSRESAEAAIEKIGVDRFKKYYFGIEEES